MSTMKLRWLGAKKLKLIQLPIGLAAIGEQYGEIACDPVGEFPVGEARKLLAMPGASTLWVPEDEYQATLNPKSEVAAGLKKQAQIERGKKLAAGLAAKRKAKQQAVPADDPFSTAEAASGQLPAAQNE